MQLVASRVISRWLQGPNQYIFMIFLFCFTAWVVPLVQCQRTGKYTQPYAHKKNKNTKKCQAMFHNLSPWLHTLVSVIVLFLRQQGRETGPCVTTQDFSSTYWNLTFMMHVYTEHRDPPSRFRSLEELHTLRSWTLSTVHWCSDLVTGEGVWNQSAVPKTILFLFGRHCYCVTITQPPPGPVWLMFVGCCLLMQSNHRAKPFQTANPYGFRNYAGRWLNRAHYFFPLLGGC